MTTRIKVENLGPGRIAVGPDNAEEPTILNPKDTVELYVWPPRRIIILESDT